MYKECEHVVKEFSFLQVKIPLRRFIEAHLVIGFDVKDPVLPLASPLPFSIPCRLDGEAYTLALLLSSGKVIADPETDFLRSLRLV